MERIKQALEKSKRQSELVSMQARVPVEQPATCAAESIIYGQTRIIPLSTAIVDRERIIAQNKSDPQSSVFKVLRTKVLQEMDRNGWRTLAITSPKPGSGKTVVSINLAIAIAQRRDRTALLIDFDARKPKIASYLGLSQDVSLGDVLHDRAAVHEVLISPSIPRLVVMPMHEPEDSPAELLASQGVNFLIEELRDRYQDRILIFDLPALLDTDDAIAVLPQIDCVLMVVGDGESTQEEIEDSMRLLSSTNLLGTVLNKIQT